MKIAKSLLISAFIALGASATTVFAAEQKTAIRAQDELFQLAKEETPNPSKLTELLAAGARLNKQNEWGSTALILAVDKGNVETVRMLIDKGANLNVKDNYGTTALDIAADRSGEKFREIYDILVKAGAKLGRFTSKFKQAEKEMVRREITIESQPLNIKSQPMGEPTFTTEESEATDAAFYQ